MDIEQLKRYVSLKKQKHTLDADLEDVKGQLADLEHELIPQFINDGVQRMTVEGRTVSLVPDIYASPATGRAEVAQALKDAGMGDYVSENYNSNSLSAYVREIWRDALSVGEADGRLVSEEDVRAALPEPLAQVLKLTLGHKLSNTKA